MQTEKTMKFKRIKLNNPISLKSFSSNDIDKIIQEGEEDIKNGRSYDAREVFKEMRKKYEY